MWWARTHDVLGRAVHQCLRHCSWLEECRRQEPVAEAVIGGVLYTRLAAPNYYQPVEIECEVCAPPPQLHGTEAGYSRHRRAGERPCTPCRNAHNAGAARSRRPKPPAPVPPAADVREERRRALVEAMKKTA